MSITEEDVQNVDLIRMILLQLNEEELQEAGYDFTYTTVALLVKYIEYIENYASELDDYADKLEEALEKIREGLDRIRSKVSSENTYG